MKVTAGFFLKTGVVLLVFGLIVIVLYDQLFSKPTIHEGVILEKIEVPRSTASGPNVTPYSRARTYKYIITSEKYHQWIALVKTDEGEILKVHCSSDHFFGKNVGDTILFKEYQGKLLKIDYLSHSEEDTVETDWNKVFHHQ